MKFILTLFFIYFFLRLIIDNYRFPCRVSPLRFHYFSVFFFSFSFSLRRLIESVNGKNGIFQPEKLAKNWNVAQALFGGWR